MGKYRVAFLVFVLVFSMCLSGCGERTADDYFRYREADFSAEVRGALYGEDFSALIRSQRTADGGRLLYISYLSPDHLEGLEIEVFPDGTASVSFDGIQTQSDRDALAGLLAPVELLVLDAELLRVRRDGKNTVLTLPDSLILTLSDSNLPLSLSSPSVSYTVVWWERL